jgi:hypothetical protein
MDAPNPSGLCLCGCGQPTTIAKKNDRKANMVKGEHMRYLVGHQRRKGPVDYIEEDCGHETPCWVWQRALMRNGYGQKWHEGRLHAAHRVYYEQIVGPIPEGMQLDHVCRTRACVNPEHLEPVTHLENVRRGDKCKTHDRRGRRIA